MYIFSDLFACSSPAIRLHSNGLHQIGKTLL